MESTLIIYIVGAVFLGSLMRSTFGFGDSVISMPLLALLPIPFAESVSLVGLVGLTVAAFSLFTGWKHIDVSVLKRLTLSTLMGIPFGLLLVNFADKHWVTFILGSLLIVYSLFSLVSSKNQADIIQNKFKNTIYALPFGFLSGMLGSAYNMNGIPIVLYGTMKNWNPEPFKDNLQAHFLISSLFIVGSHSISGFLTSTVVTYYLFSIPAIIVAIFLGKKIYSLIDISKFKTIVLCFIFLLGLILFIDSYSS